MVNTLEPPKQPSAQLKTVLRYFELVKVWDLDEVAKLFADDFVQTTRPLLLGLPARNKDEEIEFLRGFSEKLAGRPLDATVYDITEAPEKVWANILLKLHLPNGKVAEIENVYKFTFVEHSPGSYKLKTVDDFLDSAAFSRLGEPDPEPEPSK